MLECGADRRFVGHVEGALKRAMALRLEGLGRLGQFALVPAVENDRRAGPRETPRHSQAETVRGAGDERRFARQIEEFRHVHCSLRNATVGGAPRECAVKGRRSSSSLALHGGGRAPASHSQLDANRRMVGRFVAPAHVLVDRDRLQPIGGLRRQKQVVDAKAVVLLPRARLIIPERIEPARVRRRAQARRSSPAP